MSDVEQILALRDFQEDEIAAVDKYVVEHPELDKHWVIISSPTGSGKTVVACHIVKRHPDMPWLMMVHRDHLVEQTVEKMANINPGMDVGVYKAGRRDTRQHGLVVSEQTLRREDRLQELNDQFHPGRPRLLLDDECHHSAAASRRHAIEVLDPKLMVGLTATAFRSDKLSLGEIYQEIVYHIGMLPLIAQRRLSPLKGKLIQTFDNLDNVHTVAGDFNNAELEQAVNTHDLNQLIVDSWHKEAFSQGRRFPIGFCVNRRHAENLRDCFRSNGVQAEMVLGNTDDRERDRIMKAFHYGDMQGAPMLGVDVFTEGYDEPRIDTGLMARPTKSLQWYIQAVGRLARTYPGKNDALALDYVFNSMRHKLIALPTLAGIEAAGAADTPLALMVEDQITQAMADGEMFDMAEMAVELKAKIEHRAVEVDLFGGSELHWRPLEDTWMLPDGSDGGYISLVRLDGGFVPFHLAQREVDGWPGGPDTYKKWFAEALVNRPLSLELAMGSAEGLVEINPLTQKGARWRKKAESATAAQHRMAGYYKIRLPERCTKGEANELIDTARYQKALRSTQNQLVLNNA